MGSFRRPKWFVQGPRSLCIEYLIAKNQRDFFRSRRRWRLLGIANQTVKASVFERLFVGFSDVVSSGKLTEFPRRLLFIFKWQLLALIGILFAILGVFTRPIYLCGDYLVTKIRQTFSRSRKLLYLCGDYLVTKI